MCKLLGSAIISLSVIGYLLKNTYNELNTYYFLQETITVLNHFCLEIDSKKPYEKIFKNIKDLRYYNCEYKDITLSFDNTNNINAYELLKVKEIFENLGRKSAIKEKDFIQLSLNILSNRRDYLKEKINYKNRSNIVLCVSIGIFIFIVII